MKTYIKFIIAFCTLFILSFFVFVQEVKAIKKEFYDKETASTITVINYHQFGERNVYPQVDNVTNTAEEFREHLQAIKDNGYTTINQEQLIGYLKGTTKVPKKSVLITIDDGFKGVYDVAYPILKEMDMNAVLFPITAEMDRGYRKNVPMMTYENINEMINSGHIEIGNHTNDLHWRGNNDSSGFEAMIWGYDKNENALTTEERREMIYQDGRTAEDKLLKATGVKIKSISFPYGAYDTVALQAYRELGYEVGYTTKGGLNTFGSQKLMEIKRIGSTMTPEVLISKIERYIQTADKNIIKNKDIRTTVKDSSKNIIVNSYSSDNVTKNKHNIKNFKFELYTKSKEGQLKHVKTFKTVTNGVYNHYPKSNYYIEKSKLNKNLDYYVKVIMTDKNNNKEIEYINI